MLLSVLGIAGSEESKLSSTVCCPPGIDKSCPSMEMVRESEEAEEKEEEKGKE
jgi:hypothetical protein